jgi:anti-sigma factor RsiW
MKVLSQALHQLYDPVLDEPVPERLRAHRSRWRVAAIAAGWVALGLGAGVLAGWQLHAWRVSVPPQAEVPGFVKRAAVAHAVYSPEVRHPVEVGADQEQHLVAWLSKRLGAQVRAPKLEAAGYSLVGGRLLPGDNGPVAHFMYQTAQGRRITLYVRTEAAENRETAFRYAAEGNVKVFYWIDRKLAYAISSADLGKDDLLRVANAVYQQLNP